MCDGFFVGELADGRAITIDLQQVNNGQATVEVTLNGVRALQGIADCQDNGYGETDVFMEFTNGSDAEATISFDGEMYGEGLFGQTFTAYLDDDYVEEDPWAPGELPRFSDWKGEWERGLKASTEFLEGAWGLVAVATTKKCAYFAKDAYNEEGLLNKDGTVWALEFGDFDEDGTFKVMLHNLGKDEYDQGPFDVSSNEPQFKQYAYSGGQPTEDAHYEYSCRFRRGSSEQLICMTPLRVKPGVKFGKDTMDCASDTLGIVQVFNRIDAEEDVEE